MITSLSIKNFALIDQLAIDFTNGLSIITGETGAGKSIILGALGLVLGKRADLSSLKNTDEKCVIEAQFDISKYNLFSFFEENDLDYEAETIIRREILPSGKSRAFINDSPVNLQELQALSLFLIDIHSQQQTQELSEEEVQFKIIDAIADNKNELEQYQEILKKYKNHKSQLVSLQRKQGESLKEQEYHSFLLDELLSAKLIDGEQEQLEEDFEQLNNVESIKESIDKALLIAHEEEIGALHHLKEIKSTLQRIAPFGSKYQELLERMNSIIIEFDDITLELNQHAEQLLNDPEKLEYTNQKLQLIYTLQKKHQVKTVAELLVIQNELDQSLVLISNLESEINKLQELITKNEQELDALAQVIHEKRIQAIPVLTEKMIQILEKLGMPNVRFKIDLNLVPTFFSNGKEALHFLFSANKGGEFGLLKKVASGGEMSRIMLAVKAILAQYSKLPTLIFDEIDTGVSGEIAIRMGEIMKQMSTTMQVFAITHLSQIAAKGDSHFKVAKSTVGEVTNSELKLLTEEERVLEIAQMLSGTVVSESALNHAKALLN
ncbi:DNA repair protein RecN [Flavobacterium sp. RSSA_27]|uniref:DNA repair protein RecN n=1 Tax=Flavobacterium sp. RSSA_27 TaxID=3447667 RepID=UPI003F3C94E6